MAERDDELPDLPALRMLEPPPGGLARLRAALDQPARPATWLVWSSGLVAAAALVVIALVATGDRARVARTAATALAVPARVPAALPDPTISRDVAFYWAASTPAAGPAPTAPSPATAPLIAVTVATPPIVDVR